MGINLRQAIRSLLHDRNFTITAVATLGLGMGATLAVFSVIEAVLLRPLPYAAASRVVMLNHRDERTGISKDYVALGDVVDIAARSRSFDAVGTYGQGEVTVYGSGEPYQVGALFASSPIFDVLGIRPAFGRRFVREDDMDNAAPVVILGHRFWREKMGGDSAVIGRSLRVGQETRTIVGVASEGTRFPPDADTDLIMSIGFSAPPPAARRNWTLAMARLRPGVEVTAAAREVSGIARQLEAEYPETNRASTYLVVPLRDALVGNTKKALILLFAAVGAVMLIAWANVANLVLVRSLGRAREMAIRVALGAGRGRIASQVVVETAVVGVAGALVGLLVAQWSTGALVRLVPESIGVPGLESVRLNWIVVAFALGLTVVAVTLFGVVGALQARPGGVTGVLGAGLRASLGKSSRRAVSSIVCAEVAFAVLLLFGAGLVLRSFGALLAVDPGFAPDHVASVDVALPADRYATPDARRGFYDRLFPALAAVPGVTAAGGAAVTPLTGNNWTQPLILPDAPLTNGERPPEVGWQVASSGWFQALRIPLVAGRLFAATDRPDGPKVVIVSEALAKRYFPEGAVGKRVTLGNGPAEIVGVVGSIRRATLTDEPRIDMYLPLEQTAPGGTSLFVRTAGDPEAGLAAIGRAIREVERQAILSDPGTLEETARASLAVPRLLLALLTVFAGIALALAMLGIYGVTAYSVEQQRREIGTRLALGAQRADIYRLVIGRGLALGTIGTALGLAAAWFGTRVLVSMLYGTSPSDPIVIGAVPATLLLVTAVACLVPARRAARVDPVRAIAEG